MIDFRNGDFVKLQQVNDDAFLPKIGPLLVEGEHVEASFKGIRDGIVFTSKRIMTINVQGISGKKVDITSLPYKRIQVFSMETAGSLDRDTELELWFSGLGKVKFEFNKIANVTALCKLISDNVLD